MKNINETFIKQCFELALKGEGKVSPNPMVGCVVVKNDKIISTGYHKYYGTLHAEADAILNSNESVAGATLYCNLEPCCHTNKKTPPCVPLIIRSGINEVVICNIDPNPEVAGKGIKLLELAGIKVTSGVLEEEGKELNRLFFTSVKQNRPYTYVKIAQTMDGKISQEMNKQTWITGEESAKYVHELRAEVDAVLVGANTVTVDDPQLTVRLAEGKNPKRVILDGKLSSPLEAKVFNDEHLMNTIVYTSSKAEKRKIVALTNKKIEVVTFDTDDDYRLDLKQVLEDLYTKKIGKLLVEGGREIFNHFLAFDLFNELIILQSQKIFGQGVPQTDFPLNKELTLASVERLGNDVKMILTPRESI